LNRSVKIKQVVDALEHYAPLPLQEGYDNAGLQVGLTEAVEMSGALLCLDVTEAVVEEAIQKGCNLIVSHHPLIFRKLARISDENYVQRTVRKAIKNDITIVAMHTNMDAAAGGVNFKIAEKLGLRNVQFFAGEKEVDGVKGGEGVIGEVAEDLAADDLVLMLNKAVIYPTYNQPEKDEEARKQIQLAFPDREIIGVDSQTIIRQHGSIHCITMQLPEGALRDSKFNTQHSTFNI
jgi:dinuclear metal center YbgI/SA1388 family protein